MEIKLLVEGGNMTPGPAVAQQLGPMGINLGKVISDVNQATQDFKGMNVPVILDIDPKTKEFSISVSSPPTSELIKKELKLEKASGDRMKVKAGNIAIEQIIKIAKTKHPNMLAREFKSAVKSVIGTCMSLGLLIENKDPKQVLEELDSKYKTEIEQQKTEVSPEKKEKLEKFFATIQAKQEAEAKKEEEEKAAEETKKTSGQESEEEKKKEEPVEKEEKK